MLRDIFSMAMRNLRQRKLRSGLTILGIVIGIAAVVAMVSATQGISKSIFEQIEKFQGDQIFVLPGEPRMGFMHELGGMAGRLTRILTEEDVDGILKIYGVEAVDGQVRNTLPVEFYGEKLNLTIVGADPSESKKIDTLGLEGGSYLSESDRNSALIGHSVAHDGFEREVGLRKTLLIGGNEFKVVGILNKMGGTTQQDFYIYIPKRTMRDVSGISDEYVHLIVAKTKQGVDQNEVAEKIEEFLRRSHRVAEGKEDFTLITPEFTRRITGQIIGLVNILLGGVAGIALVVGAIGIANTMFTSVLERTREIGVMKAIGATNGNILELFLFESGLMGLLGGTIGAAAGLALGEGILSVAYFATSQTELMQMGRFELMSSHIAISPELIIGALVFSFAVGMIAGLPPARKAAKLPPVEALRYE